MSDPVYTEKRRGNTGIWTHNFTRDDGFVIATAEWASNHVFSPGYWERLPIHSQDWMYDAETSAVIAESLAMVEDGK